MTQLRTLAEMEATGLRDQLHRQEAAGAYWRAQAFRTFANFIFCEHVRPFEAGYTDSALCDRMNRLKVPTYRGPGGWTEDKLSGIRRALPRETRDVVDKRRKSTLS